MNTFGKIALCLTVGLVLVGCKSVTDYYGKGPITLSPRLEAGFDKYKKGPGPEYFAISQDGATYGWSYCSGGVDNCRGGGLPGAIAIESCERHSRGVPCKIYARSRWVVWDGPVTKGASSRNKNNTPNSKSADVVCAYAVDYDGDSAKWATDSARTPYVVEAKNRGFSLKDCDELN